MKDNEILHSAQELFAIIATGESGVSLRGLSRLSGIPKSSLSDWFRKDLSGQGVPGSLKALSSKALYMSGEIKIKGRVVKEIRYA